MIFQYLLIHSKALKAIIKEIKAKTQNRLFYDPSLTHGGSGSKCDQLSRLFTHGFPILLNTFCSSKSSNNGDTVEPVKSNHPGENAKVVALQRWLLFAGSVMRAMSQSYVHSIYV